MKLYHGTSTRWLPNILRQGLEPRGRRTSRSNWTETVPSNPSCVYLSDCYAPHFAFKAADARGGDCAVIEIETNRLPTPHFLLPDEDCLEQSGRGVDGVPGNMRERTLHYRREMFRRFAGSDAWELSLEYLGTCCYHGIVPPGAITRVATWPHRPNIKLLLVWDLSVSLENQRVCGDRYRVLTRKLFDGKFSHAPQQAQDIMAQPQRWFDDPPLPPIEGWHVARMD